MLQKPFPLCNTETIRGLRRSISIMLVPGKVAFWSGLFHYSRPSDSSVINMRPFEKCSDPAEDANFPSGRVFLFGQNRIFQRRVLITRSRCEFSLLSAFLISPAWLHPLGTENPHKFNQAANSAAFLAPRCERFDLAPRFVLVLQFSQKICSREIEQTINTHV